MCIRDSCRNAFVTIFVPKLVSMVTPLCPLCTGVSQMNSPMAQISKPNSAWMCRLQLKLWPFLWLFWPILAKIWLRWQRPLDPCNQKCLIWIARPLKPCPRTKKFVNSCYRSEVVDSKVRDKFSITGIGNFRYFCNKYGKLYLKINLTPKRTYLAWKHVLRAINNVSTIYSATCAGEQEHKKYRKIDR